MFFFPLQASILNTVRVKYRKETQEMYWRPVIVNQCGPKLFGQKNTFFYLFSFPQEKSKSSGLEQIGVE